MCLTSLKTDSRKSHNNRLRFIHLFLIALIALSLLNLVIAIFSKLRADITTRFFADILNQQILSIDNELGNGKNSETEAEKQRLAILKKNQKLEIAAKRLKNVKFMLLGFILCACLLYVLLFFFLK